MRHLRDSGSLIQGSKQKHQLINTVFLWIQAIGMCMNWRQYEVTSQL